MLIVIYMWLSSNLMQSGLLIIQDGFNKMNHEHGPI